jgi:hypothetical protein
MLQFVPASELRFLDLRLAIHRLSFYEPGPGRHSQCFYEPGEPCEQQCIQCLRLFNTIVGFAAVVRLKTSRMRRKESRLVARGLPLS